MGLRGPVVFVDETTDGWAPLDGCDVHRLGDWLWLWRTQSLPAMWPLVVVMIEVFDHYRYQVMHAEDQHAGGDFGPDGAHEPFGVAVRVRAPRWNFHDLDRAVGEHGIE